MHFKSFIESVHRRMEQELIRRINARRDPVGARDLGKDRKLEIDSLALEGTFSTFFIIWGIAATDCCVRSPS